MEGSTLGSSEQITLRGLAWGSLRGLLLTYHFSHMLSFIVRLSTGYVGGGHPCLDRAAPRLTGQKKSSFIQPRWGLALLLAVGQLLCLGCLDLEEMQVGLSEQCHED